MKKHLCMAVAACGLLSLASCSDDENVVMNDQPVVAEGEQIITLNVQNTDVLSTKSRPLYSTENKGAGEVTDVALLIFKMADTNDGYPMELEQVINIPRWDQLATEYGPNANVDYGHKYTIELGKDYNSEKLDVGSDYTIIAVGQNETEDDVVPPYQITRDNGASLISELEESLWDNKSWTASATIGDGFLTTVKDETVSHYGEIFSGTSKPVHLNLKGEGEDGGFTAEVLLKRQVAGVIGYFSQIPAYINYSDKGNLAVKKIRLVASAKNDQIDLTRSLGDQSDDATGAGKTEAVVNGFGGDDITADAAYGTSDTNNAYTVYEINLKDWFVPASTASGNGNTPDNYWGINVSPGSDIPTLGSNGTTWKNGIDGANQAPRVATNAVLAGEFVIPFGKDLNNDTFELQLLGTYSEGSANSECVLKTWRVRLDEASAAENDGDYVYSIYRNHLYQIGQRGSGDSPVDPGEGDDNPQPLDGSQDLVIKINDNWEIIHNMVID